MQNIKKGIPLSMKVKKGMSLKCLGGIVWVTSEGEDFILHNGDAQTWNRHQKKIVLLPLNSDAVIDVSDNVSLFEEFSLFNKQARFTGSFAG